MELGTERPSLSDEPARPLSTVKLKEDEERPSLEDEVVAVHGKALDLADRDTELIFKIIKYYTKDYSSRYDKFTPPSATILIEALPPLNGKRLYCTVKQYV